MGSDSDQLKSFWVAPWSYPQTTVILASLWMTGFFLEFLTQGRGLSIPEFPHNLFLLFIFLVFFTSLHLVRTKSALPDWLASTPVAIISLGGLLVLGTIAAIWPQDTIEPSLFLKKWGLTHIVRSWPFALNLLLLMASLYLASLKHLWPLNFKNLTFLLNHLGLLIIIMAAALGSGDFKRLTIDLNSEELNWQGRDSQNQLYNLPFALKLKKFEMEEYPAEIALLEEPKHRFTAVTSTAGAEKKYKFHPPYRINDWVITVTDYWPFGIKFADKFHPMEHYGATQVVFVKAENSATQEIKEVALSSGSSMMAPESLKLGELRLIMLPPKAKKFLSKGEFFTKSGKKGSFQIEVNKPLKLESWMLYQYSYDERAGRFSQLSVLEAIRDPWLPFVYLGITFMILGSVFLFWRSRNYDS